MFGSTTRKAARSPNTASRWSSGWPPIRTVPDFVHAVGNEYWWVTVAFGAPKFRDGPADRVLDLGNTLRLVLDGLDEGCSWPRSSCTRSVPGPRCLAGRAGRGSRTDRRRSASPSSPVSARCRSCRDDRSPSRRPGPRRRIPGRCSRPAGACSDSVGIGVEQGELRGSSKFDSLSGASEYGTSLPSSALKAFFSAAFVMFRSTSGSGLPRGRRSASARRAGPSCALGAGELRQLLDTDLPNDERRLLVRRGGDAQLRELGLGGVRVADDGREDIDLRVRAASIWRSSFGWILDFASSRFVWTAAGLPSLSGCAAVVASGSDGDEQQRNPDGCQQPPIVSLPSGDA